MSDAGNSNDDAGNAGDDSNVPIESQAQADSSTEAAVQSSGVDAPVDSDSDESAAASQADAAEQASGENAPIDSDSDEAAAASQADAAEQASGEDAPIDNAADEQKAAEEAAAAESAAVTSDDNAALSGGDDNYGSLAADFSNTDDGGESGGVLETEWSNVGLEGNEAGGAFEPNWGNAALQKFDPSYATLEAPSGSVGVRLNTNPGLAMFFSVTIDALDMGTWTTCSGLGMAIEHPTRSDSAMSMFQNKLPGNITYSNITLGRPVTSDTGVLLSWFSTYHMLPIPGAGEITLLDQSGAVVMSWALLGVRPVSWKGPSLDAGSGSNLAMETLEIAHMGFM